MRSLFTTTHPRSIKKQNNYFVLLIILLTLFFNKVSLAQSSSDSHSPPGETVTKVQKQLKSLRAERVVFQRALKKATVLQRKEQIALLQKQLDDIDAKTKASLKIIYRLPENAN